MNENFSYFNDKIIDLSKQINDFLTSKMNNKVLRNRKTNITDGVLFKLFNTEVASTYDKSAIKINNYKYQYITTQSYYNRSSEMDISTYYELSELIGNYIKKTFYKDQQYIILAVDGTYAQFKKSINEDNLNFSENSTTNLITGIYNVTHEYPEFFKFEKNDNERESILNIIKEKYIDEKHIFVMDRGYMGQNLFNNIHITNNYFLCRLRGNLKWFKNVNNTNINKIDPDDYYVDVNYENLKKLEL